MRIFHFAYLCCQLQLDVYFLPHPHEQNNFYVRCGRAVCGMAKQVFSMLVFITFRPGFSKTFYYYEEYQFLFDRMPKKLKIEFVPCFNFSMTKKLEECLLVSDDSCKETYQEKKFVKFAVAGRHKIVHCVFLKHNLFHQSK